MQACAVALDVPAVARPRSCRSSRTVFDTSDQLVEPLRLHHVKIRDRHRILRWTTGPLPGASREPTLWQETHTRVEGKAL